jgi:soluble lytic murein transglycosylase
MTKLGLSATVALLIVAGETIPRAQQARAAANGDGNVDTILAALAPTRHPAVPGSIAELWLAPDRGARSVRSSSAAALATAVKLTNNREYTKALGLVTQPAVQQGPLSPYASYYAALAQLRLGKDAQALQMFRALSAQHPVGYLAEAARFGEADALLAANNADAAAAVIEDIVKGKPSQIEETYIRLGRAYKAAGHTGHAAEAFARVYYEFALSEEAASAGTELALIGHLEPMAAGSQRYTLELGRAERFFAARQYQPARNIFDSLRPFAGDEDRRLLQLRLAESDYFLKKQTIARESLRSLITPGPRQAEALYFFAIASRALKDDGTYTQTVRRLVTEFPKESWTEDALDNLGDYYLKRNEDDLADTAFRQLYAMFPRGSHAENAAWKAGWRAYRVNRYQETIGFFERASADFPRSDFRPAFLYWSARAHEALKETAQAEERYALCLVDYMNTYHGRLAVAHLGERSTIVRTAYLAAQTPRLESLDAIPPPPNAGVVRSLLGMEMYEDALNELRYAQRVWTDSATIQATIAWINQQQARNETGARRFELLRGSINMMKRAYPQYLTAGGENLPRDVQSVIFPIAYWDLIRKYSTANNLDPYLIAALVQQESTFVADIKSYANAYGLMQLLPVTGREYAKKLNIPYSQRLLTNPEANIRMGTAKFAEDLRTFGQVHLVLASYNAGGTPVRRWVNERPGIDRDEFIDDIPYPQTNAYVKKILAMAEDYRRLYGPNAGAVDSLDKTPVAPAPAGAPAQLAVPPKATPPPPQPARRANAGAQSRSQSAPASRPPQRRR